MSVWVLNAPKEKSCNIKVHFIGKLRKAGAFKIHLINDLWISFKKENKIHIMVVPFLLSSNWFCWRKGIWLLSRRDIFAKRTTLHCAKSVCIRSFSGPYFTALGLNTEISLYSVRMRKNEDQKISKYGHFSRSVSCLTEFWIHLYNFTT